QLQPADVAGREVHEAEPGLGLGVADLGARVDVLRVAGRGDVVRDDGAARIACRLVDVQDRVAAAGLRRDRLDALLGRDVDGLHVARLAGLAAAAHLVAALDLAPDVLEELFLLLLEEPTLACGLAFFRRRAGADVGELADRPAVQGHGEDVVLLNEVDGPAVVAEDGVGLGRARVGEAAHGEGAPVDEPEVALVGDDAPAFIRRDVAGGEENAEGVRGLVREALGGAAGGGDAVERGFLVPRPAARLPAEVDPAAVVGPPDGGGRRADVLRPAHDVGDAQLERAGGRARRRLGVSGTRGRQGVAGP